MALVDGLARAITRPELAEVLEGAPKSDPRYEHMYNMLFDPSTRDMKLATMARRCELTYGELTDAIRKHKHAEAIVVAAMDAPKIMSEVVADARNKLDMCPKCQGIGSIFDPINKDQNGGQIPITCPQCKGAGEITKSGDAEARKQVFKSMGLIGDRGPLIAVQNNTLQAGDGDDLESILAMGKKKALPPQPTITVEQVKEEG